MERQIRVDRFFSFHCRMWCFSLVVFGVLGLATGCSVKTVAVAPPPAAFVLPPITVESDEGVQWPDKDLQTRFQQYWTLRKAGNAVGSFEYEAPHVREMVIWGRYEGFGKRVRNDWLTIRVLEIKQVTEQLIEIDFNMVAKNKNKEGAKRDVFFRDSWLFFSGRWYHVLKDPFVTGDGLGK